MSDTTTVLAMDRVNFSFRMCPHINYRVHALEEWGVAHTYTFSATCDICGPLTHREFRPRDTG
jgi:hypothetical protein